MNTNENEEMGMTVADIQQALIHPAVVEHLSALKVDDRWGTVDGKQLLLDAYRLCERMNVLMYVYQLEKNVNIQGHSHTELVKTVASQEKAEQWLETKGYVRVADRWENKRDSAYQDPFDGHVFLKVKKVLVE